MSEKSYVSYNQLHEIICRTVKRNDLAHSFAPTLLIAISAGGFLPTRILRNILKNELGGKSLPIQTIGLCLYESETKEIYKTQWIPTDLENDPLAISFDNQRILIVDEVDETRRTLGYAAEQLMKDIDRQRLWAKKNNRSWNEPKLGVFVVHNKSIKKQATLPDEIMAESYFVGENVGAEWIVYPWDALDIDEHTRLADETYRNRTRKNGTTTTTTGIH